MNLRDELTIVIPCKNESEIIETTLSLLNKQKNIQKVDVIVSDSSTDMTTFKLETRDSDVFNLSIIQGGLPSFARNEGAKKVKTPYVLFLDADVFILNPDLLKEAVLLMKRKDLHLLTVRFRTTTGEYNYIYKAFDKIQGLTKPFSPFSLGGFMLFNIDVFNSLGGFDEEAKVAEDYLLSKRVTPKKFKALKSHVFTTPRRFKNKGVFYMIKLMLQSFFNRNNRAFFTKHNTYWNETKG
jgi:glycosyltransferase involved in cell wall biosynthesis